MEKNQRNKGRIIVVIFLVILLLPACYALVKEFLIKPKTEKTVPKADSAK